MIRTAQIISAIFNPLVLIVFIASGIVFYETGNSLVSIQWFFIAAIFSSLFAVFILVSIKKGIFSNFDVSTQAQRPKLFLAAAVSVLLAMVFVGFFIPSINISIALLVSLVGIFLYSIITTKIKASVHIGVLSVFVCLLVFLFGKWMAISIFLIPVVAWARVHEKEHTPREVLVGLVLGLLLSAFLLFLLQ